MKAAIRALPLPVRRAVSPRDRALGAYLPPRQVLVSYRDRQSFLEGDVRNSYVRDRGVKIGDVLLLRTRYLPEIRVTVIRIAQNGEQVVIPPPPLPNRQPPDDDQMEDQDQDDDDDQMDDQDQDDDRDHDMFLCVKKVSRSDFRGAFKLPTEIAELIEEGTESIEVFDEAISYPIDMPVSFRGNGVFLEADKWSWYFDLVEGDLIVFLVDLPSRLTLEVYRATHSENLNQDFIIPPAMTY
ncbi:hypothetical protein TorRG33x02_193300 [Trema orientale]|uniref:Uncharacterized protein n=1 Tax=Trema orientale TaxID=63057 RepID=A0A2P5EHC5_TREOI|nr:hypothetical protein TorRG33x02_193300 [Trema orientale]